MKLSRVIGLPHHWQNLGSCVIIHMVLPLAPLWAQLLIKGQFTQETLLITASVYSLMLGETSRNNIILALGIGEGVIFAIAYGSTLSSTTEIRGINIAVIWGLIALFAFTLAESYNRYGIEKEPYWASFKK